MDEIAGKNIQKRKTNIQSKEYLPISTKTIHTIPQQEKGLYDNENESTI
jgi:hypothetical protein